MIKSIKVDLHEPRQGLCEAPCKGYSTESQQKRQHVNRL